ncbi:MAG: ABC transporter permease subunit [Naasia sp.]
MSATSTLPSRTAHPVSFLGVLRSEWIKLTTVRSTYWTIGIAVLLAFGMAALLGLTFSLPGSGAPAGAAAAFGLQAATISLTFVALPIAVLGALAVTGEYGTGMIRSSFQAVPRRLPVLAAKAIVIGATGLVVGLVTTFGSFLIAAPLMGAQGTAPALSDEGTVAGLIGGAVYLAVVAVFGLGVGALVRNSAAAISIAVGLLFVAPIVLSLLGALLQAEWAQEASKYLLSNAGADLYAPPAGGVLELPIALAALAGWLLAAWIPALVLTRTRDVS